MHSGRTSKTRRFVGRCAPQPIVPLRLRIVGDAVDTVIPEDASVLLRAGGREERVSLVIAADGRQSVCRRAAGIGTDAKQLPQTAIVVNLRHSRPHGNFSTEFHTESGPFTLVPLAGNRSSLVWVVTPARGRCIARAR